MMLRVAAGLAAVAASIPLPFGAWLGFFSVLVAAQRPDPTIADGDPCCSHPDTWSEVALGVAYGAVALLGCAALLYFACFLALFALSGTRLTREQVRHLAVAAAVALSATGLWLLS